MKKSKQSKRFTEEERAEIIRLHIKESSPAVEIAKKFDSCYGTIKNLLEKEGCFIKIKSFNLKNKKFINSDEKDNQICELYKSGTPVSKIAKDLNTCIARIYRIIKNNDVELLTKGKRKRYGQVENEERKSKKYSIWRDAIHRLFNNTCQISGEMYVKMDAHHLFNWKDFPNKRFDIDNGILIRSDLHYLFHFLYGKKKNTPSQFEEFKSRYLSGEFKNNIELINDFSI